MTVNSSGPTGSQRRCGPRRPKPPVAATGTGLELMAKKNFREHLRGEEVRYKKYLYVLRPLLAARWIRAGKGVPPMRFAALAEATLDDRALLDEINRLLEVKMRAGEAATSPRWVGIHNFIENELETAGAQLVVDSSRPDTSMLDAFLYETVQKNEREKNGTD